MYSQEISRRHRIAIVIAIDQSCSMSGTMVMNGWSLSKAEVLSVVTGRLIDELIMRSYRDGVYRHYYDIALIGYSGDSVYSLLGDELQLLPITDLVGRDVPKYRYPQSYKTLNADYALFEEKVSMWVEPRAEGATPMLKMLN